MLALMSHKGSRQRGQVMLEYALTMLIVLGMSTLLYLFYQSLVQANVYGTAGDDNALYLLNEDYASLGLTRMSALPIP